MPCTRCSDPRQCEDKCRLFGAEHSSVPAPAHSKSEYKRRVAQGDTNVLPPAVGVGAPDTWLPTADNINALPEPVRRYIADLETMCDPAGLVRENAQLKDTNRGLQAMYRRAVDAGVNLPDGPKHG